MRSIDVYINNGFQPVDKELKKKIRTIGSIHIEFIVQAIITKCFEPTALFTRSRPMVIVKP